MIVRPVTSSAPSLLHRHKARQLKVVMGNPTTRVIPGVDVPKLTWFNDKLTELLKVSVSHNEDPDDPEANNTSDLEIWKIEMCEDYCPQCA